MQPLFFASPDAWRAWLQRHHASASEVLVGFWKVGTGKASMTWGESVDEAICYGWIDGVRRSLGEDAYTIRFTPRKAGATWSKVNIAKAQQAIASGRMRPSGLAAFEARTDARTGVYSFERPEAAFTPAQERSFRDHKQAWEDWQARTPSYRKAATHWVTSAKREVTRAARLDQLVAACAKGEPAPPFRWAVKPAKAKPRPGPERQPR